MLFWLAPGFFHILFSLLKNTYRFWLHLSPTAKQTFPQIFDANRQNTSHERTRIIRDLVERHRRFGNPPAKLGVCARDSPDCGARWDSHTTELGAKPGNRLGRGDCIWRPRHGAAPVFFCPTKDTRQKSALLRLRPLLLSVPRWKVYVSPSQAASGCAAASQSPSPVTSVQRNPLVCAAVVVAITRTLPTGRAFKVALTFALGTGVCEGAGEGGSPHCPRCSPHCHTPQWPTHRLRRGGGVRIPIGHRRLVGRLPHTSWKAVPAMGTVGCARLAAPGG